ncbi:hypothetical protein EBZ80_01000 [bacterium]|nr:hypothetical protein [bacterium]
MRPVVAPHKVWLAVTIEIVRGFDGALRRSAPLYLNHVRASVAVDIPAGRPGFRRIRQIWYRDTDREWRRRRCHRRCQAKEDMGAKGDKDHSRNEFQFSGGCFSRDVAVFHCVLLAVRPDSTLMLIRHHGELA